MSNALQIGGHSLVLCVRSEFLTLKKAIVRYEHNIREVKHASLRLDILEVTAEIIDT